MIVTVRARSHPGGKRAFDSLSGPKPNFSGRPSISTVTPLRPRSAARSQTETAPALSSAHQPVAPAPPAMAVTIGAIAVARTVWRDKQVPSAYAAPPMLPRRKHATASLSRASRTSDFRAARCSTKRRIVMQ
jgi:hypothetical protein